jgi:hypothetical protein
MRDSSGDWPDTLDARRPLSRQPAGFYRGWNQDRRMIRRHDSRCDADSPLSNTFFSESMSSVSAEPSFKTPISMKEESREDAWGTQQVHLLAFLRRRLAKKRVHLIVAAILTRRCFLWRMQTSLPKRLRKNAKRCTCCVRYAPFRGKGGHFRIHLRIHHSSAQLARSKFYS